MPKMKIPRKSTSIDMTAMCDVAFLLLSFFIFTAKFKKSEEIAITAPNSVSTDTLSVKNKFNIYMNVTKTGKVLLGLEDDSSMKVLATEINKQKALGLTPTEIDAFGKKTAMGMDFKDMKSYLSSLSNPIAPPEQDGIPVLDSSNNQLKDWIDATAGTMFMSGRADNPDLSVTVYVKADKEAPYKVVDRVMETFAKKSQDRFKLVTIPEDIPMGTAMYEKKKAGKL